MQKGRLGILGGGQLARMIALEAATLGLECHILSPGKKDPAAQVTGFWHKGDPENLKDVQKFCEQIDLLTFESEFSPKDILEFLATQKNVDVFPEPQLMSQFQDRASQKTLLQKYKIPTAPWVSLLPKAKLADPVSELGLPLIIKKSLGGYDGNGTFVLKTKRQSKDFTLNEPAIAETYIPFKRELAVVLVRGRNGSIIELPFVQSQQMDQRCDWVVGPVSHKKFKSLVSRLQQMLKAEKYVGAIAFEIFDTGKDLLVNELAPRVHNTGHYSQNALSESQFMLHLKAGLGLDLTKPAPLAKHFCMVNLIGSGKKELYILAKSLVGHLHWYGKSENRKGRKMGHLNYLGSNTKKLLTLALKERKRLRL